MVRISYSVLTVYFALLVLAFSQQRGLAADHAARELLDASGVQGGLIVHLDCGDGQLTAALKANDRYWVHGLTASARDLAAARATVRERGEYGGVSIDRFDGRRLPYVDNLVNLVVAEDLGDVPLAEVLRVLCPGGVALVRSGQAWQKTTKPRPDSIDDWTHYLHSPDNNAVARDSQVAMPRSIQWVSGPRWGAAMKSWPVCQPQ